MKGGLAMKRRNINLKEMAHTLGRVLRYMLKNYKGSFCVVVVCTLVSALCTLSGTLFLQSLIDDYILPLTQSAAPDFGPLGWALAQMACVYALGILSSYGYNRIMVNISQGTMRNLRDDLFTHMESLPIQYFDTHAHGDIMSVYTNDVDTLRQVISQTIPQMINSLVTMVITLVSLEDFRQLNQSLRDSADKANTFANIAMPVNGNLGNISYVLCAAVGALLALSGHSSLTLGTLVAFLNLNKNATQPVSQISQQTNSIVMAMAGAQRVFDLMDAAPETDNGYVELVNAKEDRNGNLVECAERTNVWAWKHPHQADGTVTYTRLQGDVTFDDVDFGYEEGKIVLHNIKLYATPGQKIAFVGSTGAGKTTITNLINRFYDIADGKIRYDGININKIKKGDLRRSLGMVLQDVHLFTGTVMENIRYGRLDATDEECIAAAKLANADGFIRRLPDGYNRC